jgi:hypothetical protein
VSRDPGPVPAGLAPPTDLAGLRMSSMSGLPSSSVASSSPELEPRELIEAPRSLLVRLPDEAEWEAAECEAEAEPDVRSRLAEVGEEAK